MALGSETGGSVRQPAAFCGVAGLKPTYGRVSRYGLVAFASSMDQIGTFGRTVADAARLLDVVAGYDPRTPRPPSSPRPTSRGRWGAGVEGLVIGVPREYFPDSLDPGMRDLLERALAALEREGAELREVSLPHTRFAIPTYYVLAPAEASSNLSRFDGVRYGARAGERTTSARCTRRPELAASGGRSSVASCSAPTRSPPATTTSTTAAPSGPAAAS
jgi:aspartyl-tRNA(Asn)/glutamyl-tRNA(Gln) amidotransferase subunit A